MEIIEADRLERYTAGLQKCSMPDGMFAKSPRTNSLQDFLLAKVSKPDMHHHFSLGQRLQQAIHKSQTGHMGKSIDIFEDLTQQWNVARVRWGQGAVMFNET